MPLPDAVVGQQRPGLTLTWTRSDGTAEDLTGATLSGILRHTVTGAARAIAGTLEVSDAANGVFTWAFDAADVATAGLYAVQFRAAFGAGTTPALTFVTTWLVRDALEVC